MSSERHVQTRRTLLTTTGVFGVSAIAGILGLITTLLASGFGGKSILVLAALIGGSYYFLRSWRAFADMDYSKSTGSAWLSAILSALGALMAYGFLF